MIKERVSTPEKILKSNQRNAVTCKHRRETIIIYIQCSSIEHKYITQSYSTSSVVFRMSLLSVDVYTPWIDLKMWNKFMLFRHETNTWKVIFAMVESLVVEIRNPTSGRIIKSYKCIKQHVGHIAIQILQAFFSN